MQFWHRYGSLALWGIFSESRRSVHTLVTVGWVLLYVHRNRRPIRDGSPGRPPRLWHSSWGLTGGGERGRLHTYRYTVTTRMTPACIIWCFINCDGQSLKTVSTNHNLFEEKGQPERNWAEALLLTSRLNAFTARLNLSHVDLLNGKHFHPSRTTTPTTTTPIAFLPFLSSSSNPLLNRFLLIMIISRRLEFNNIGFS